MDNIKTQVKIKAVEADNQKRSKIDAEIPAFESSYDIRFITWWTSQGQPPNVGDVGVAEMKPVSRQPYFIKKGVLEEGEPDGTEKLYQLYWDMVSFTPNSATNGQSTHKPTGTDKTSVSEASGAVFLDANERYRIDNLMKNARDALWMTINHGATGERGGNLYSDMDSVVKESLVVRKELDKVLGSYLGKPAEPLPDIRNSDDLAAFTKQQGWTKSQIIQALNDEGFKDSQEFLAVDGHTVMGLAVLLVESIGV